MVTEGAAMGSARWPRAADLISLAFLITCHVAKEGEELPQLKAVWLSS